MPLNDQTTQKPQLIQDLEKDLRIEFSKESLEDLVKWKYSEQPHAEYSVNELNQIDGLCLAKFSMSHAPKIISQFRDLKVLKMNNNSFKYLDILPVLTKLEILILSNNYIDDLSDFTFLVNLKKLHLAFNQVKDLSALRNLENLQFLDLDKNRIEDLSPLSDLKKLEELSLKANNISDLSPLSALSGLRELYLFTNQITTISPLSGLSNISILDLGANQIRDISPLANLTNLSKLQLPENLISDISPLKELKKLNYLSLQTNPISSLEPWICDFPNMDIQWEKYGNDGYITFENNPLEAAEVRMVIKGKTALKDWFDQSERYGKQKGYEAKILIVGEPGSGKTTLLRKLFDDNTEVPSVKGEQPSTLGIEVKKNRLFRYIADPKINISSNI